MFFLPLPLVILEILIFTTWVHFYNFWDVLLWYFFPCFIGAVLFSLAGRSMMTDLQGSLQKGQMPGDQVLHKTALIVGSLLLMVPLFTTRIIAIILILPGLRHLGIWVFKYFLMKRLARGPFRFATFGNFGGTGGGGFTTGPQHRPYPQGPHHERDAEVVDVSPIEITHTNITEKSPEDSEDPNKKS